MTTRATFAAAVIATPDDYTYCLQVRAASTQIVDAVTDGALISRWWTSAAHSEQHGDDVRLFTGDGALLATITIGHPVGTNDVSWSVTACILPDWIGTKPTFTVRPADDGTCMIELRHVGLRPALDCFDQCRAGWGHFMPSLQQFLETGQGRPNQPREKSS